MTQTVTRDLAVLYALTTEARLGSKAVAALIAHFGDPAAVWDADITEVAEVARVGDEDLEKLDGARNMTDALIDELEMMIDQGTIPIPITAREYPERLLALSDPPSILYVRGALPVSHARSVAVVGTHQADAEGIADAVRWGKGFAERDVVVVSGLARGVDGGAHTGALAANGQTCAVLGAGFDNIYPPEHNVLAEAIEKTGALISEYAPRATLTKPRLVYRNRIIVALADAVVVVRLHEDSKGSMEAIRRARDLAVPVFLVAHDTSRNSQIAVAEGAIPIPADPDFDLVLNYL
jgi:DNA processing protein